MQHHETIDFHLRWLWLKIFRIYNLEAAKFGGTISVGYTLLNIDKDGTPSTKLGPKMGIESRSLTRTLKSMEEDGLITRTADNKDKRLMVVRLTDDGKKYRDMAKKTVLDLNTYLAEHLDEKEVDSFLNVARKINLLLDDKKIFKHKTETTPNPYKQ
jgi:DNA-binding MarR family transcriptional regulator